MTGESSVQTPGLHLPKAGLWQAPPPNTNLSHGGTEASKLSLRQPRAIVSAVIYVKLCGLLVLTVPVLSNGNNYGSSSFIYGTIWGERGLE